MRNEPVEIYSDQTNAAIMRHPGRRFPGLLIQGDTLHSLCKEADTICAAIGPEHPGFEDANDLRNRLWAFLNHYKVVLTEHHLPLPFSSRT